MVTPLRYREKHLSPRSTAAFIQHIIIYSYSSFLFCWNGVSLSLTSSQLSCELVYHKMVSNHQGVFILRKIFTALCLLVCATVFYLYQTNPGNITQKFSIRPASAHRLYPSNWTLINLKRFEFLLNSDVCGNKDEVGNNPLLLIIVTSHPGHVSLRQAFRNSLSSRILRQFGVRRMFLLGRINPFQENYSQVDQSVVETEHQQYGDIAQGDFVESYKNLSYKHIMGLKHAVNFCPHTKYVLKMDDDIAVDIFQLLAHIKPNNISGLALAGAVMMGQELHPLRDRSSKWFVTREEYALESYPPFVSGWAYVTSITAAKELVERSESSPYFWIDDVYVSLLFSYLNN